MQKHNTEHYHYNMFPKDAHSLTIPTFKPTWSRLQPLLMLCGIYANFYLAFCYVSAYCLPILTVQILPFCCMDTLSRL